MPAIQPAPAAAATNVSVGIVLTWQNGGGATSYDVRFGTTNPPPFVVNQAGNTYSPGALTPGTTYFWRIDPKNARGSTIGPVWSFTALPTPGQANVLSPANGAVNRIAPLLLSWTPGPNAVSHDVHFGTTNPPAFLGNSLDTSFEVTELTAGQTYYWRIDERNSSGKTTGQIWSFTAVAAPGQATIASPLNGGINIAGSPVLAWTPGANAVTHKVYLGTDATPDETEFVSEQSGNTYSPGALTPDTTYYWRIDEVNSAGTTTGVVWSFTTAAAGNVDISGTVMDRFGNPFPDLLMVLTGTGASAGVNRTNSTNSLGKYSVTVPSGWTGTISTTADVSMTPTSLTLTNVTSEQLAQSFVKGTNYYVAPAGNNNNPGTAAAPKLTIAAALNIAALGAGDTIILRSGTYIERIIAWGKSGSSGLPIVMRSASGLADESVIWSGEISEISHFPNCASLTNTQWWLFKGIIFEKTDGKCFQAINGTHNIDIEDCDFRNAIGASGGVGLAICSSSVAADSTVPSNINVKRCKFYDCDRYGMQIGLNGSGRAWDILVEDCDAFDNGAADYEEASGFAASHGVSTGLTPTQRITFRRCLSYNNISAGFETVEILDSIIEDCFWWGATLLLSPLGNGRDADGRGCVIGLNAGTSNVIVRRCVGFRNARLGLETNAAPGAQILNCTFFDNGTEDDVNQPTNVRAGVWHNSGTMKNCLIFDNVNASPVSVDMRRSASAISDYNFIGDGSVVEAHGLTGDPEIVSKEDALQAATDYENGDITRAEFFAAMAAALAPAEGSPLINAGENLATIGAFEAA